MPNDRIQLSGSIGRGQPKAAPPFIPQRQRDGAEVQKTNPQGSRLGRDR